jgi:dolichyl-phosphate-mannose-protein mannosyltransferase
LIDEPSQIIDRLAPEPHIASGGSHLRRVGIFLLSFCASLAVLLLLQHLSGSHSAELSGYPDEPAHYVTGLMVRGYVVHGWRSGSPMRYAEDFYLHYPKVALGHWPPGYYLLQLLWTVVFPTSISSILYLQAATIAATSAVLFTIARGRFGVPTAIVLCGAFLVLHPTQMLASQVMSEPLLTLSTLLAVWAIARYFETGRLAWIVAFVAFVVVAVHTKGSGLLLVGVPVVLLFLVRPLRELHKRSFVIAVIVMFLLLAPWQLATMKMESNGMSGGINATEIVTQAREFLPIIGQVFGWPLIAVIAIGGWLVVFGRRARDPLLVSCAATAVLTYVFHSISPVGAEDRRLFMAMPGMLMLAPVPLRAWLPAAQWKWAPGAMLALVLVSMGPSFSVYHKIPVGYRAVADWLIGNSWREPEAILIASDVDGEGMLISEIAQRQPTPSLYVVRTSKLFENCDWLSKDCKMVVEDPAGAGRVMDQTGIRYVVVDTLHGNREDRSAALLRESVASRPDLWELRKTEPANAPTGRTSGEIRIYERRGLSATGQVRVRVDLTRMLGRVIGR